MANPLLVASGVGLAIVTYAYGRTGTNARPAKYVPLLTLASAALVGAGVLSSPAPAVTAIVPQSQVPPQVPIGERGLVRFGPAGGAPELGTPTDPSFEDLIVVVDGVEGDRLRVRAVGFRRRVNGVLTRTILPASDSFTVRTAAVRPEDRILS